MFKATRLVCRNPSPRFTQRCAANHQGKPAHELSHATLGPVVQLNRYGFLHLRQKANARCAARVRHCADDLSVLRAERHLARRDWCGALRDTVFRADLSPVTPSAAAAATDSNYYVCVSNGRLA